MISSARLPMFVALVVLIAPVGASRLLATEAPVTETATPDASADPAALSDTDRAALVALLADSRDRVETLIARTPAELWSVKPAPERWSVAEVVEHLILSESVIRGAGLGALDSEPHADWEAVATRTSSDQLIATVADRSTQFQAPEVLQPKGTLDRDSSLRQFSGERAVTLDFVRRTTAPLARYVAEGPPGTMNVVQWLTLVGAHTQRHAAQIEETLAIVHSGAVSDGAVTTPVAPATK